MGVHELSQIWGEPSKMRLRIEEYNLLVVTKNEITPYRVWSAATDDSVGFWDEGRTARLRESAASPGLNILVLQQAYRCYYNGVKPRKTLSLI